MPNDDDMMNMFLSDTFYFAVSHPLDKTAPIVTFTF